MPNKKTVKKAKKPAKAKPKAKSPKKPTSIKGNEGVSAEESENQIPGSEMLQNPQWEIFAQEYSTGKAKGRAYMAAYEDIKDIYSASSCAYKLLKITQVKERVDFLRQELEEEYTLTRKQKRMFLKRVIETPIDQLHTEEGSDNADLIQSKTTTTRIDKNGTETTSVSITGISKSEAIKIDNAMAGHNEPEEVNHKISGELGFRPFQFTKTQIENEENHDESTESN